MRIAAALILVVAGFWACADAKKELPDVSLATLAGAPASLRACPTQGCVTVYVAPWCPHCRSTTPGLLELREALARSHVALKIVVGMDKPEAVRAYAGFFGPDTLLDPDRRFPVNGVPHFFVTDPQGRVVRDYAGVPGDGASGRELAQAFGLPWPKRSNKR